MAHLGVKFLGTFEVSLNSEPITPLLSDKARALLCYLVVGPKQAYPRAHLAGLLWPDMLDTSARNNLRQVLSRLRQVLQTPDGSAPFLFVTRKTIQFNIDSSQTVDIHEFTSLLSSCKAHPHEEPLTCQPCLESLQQAAHLYQGGFVEQPLIRDSDLFEAWAVRLRTSYHEQALELFYQLAACYEARGELAQAGQFAREQLTLEPWREEAHRQLMHIYAISGQRSSALAQYKGCCQILREELDVEPSAETTALFHLIRDDQIELYSADHDKAKTEVETELETAAKAETAVEVVLPKHNLPVQLTPFIGRVYELKEICDKLLHPDCRLLTLLGPGGIGKTRMALAAAERLLAHFSDGIYFIPFAATEQPDMIASAILHEMKLSFSDDPESYLSHYLQDKELLLVLDNLEHLIQDMQLLPRILFSAPKVKLLITSRIRVNLQSEWLCNLMGLEVPSLGSSQGVHIVNQPMQLIDKRHEASAVNSLLNLAEISDYHAVQLFVRRAKCVQPDFSITAQNVYDIVRICQLVEGMPLGLELAASWVRMLSTYEIAQEISENLDVLRTSLSDIPDRHRSMQAVFDYSWHRLAPHEQNALMKLSIFQGGFLRDAAAKIANARLPILMVLMDKSLVRRAATEEEPGSAPPRYELHELLRQFAYQKLSLDPNHQLAVYAAHASYFSDFLAKRQNCLGGSQLTRALQEIEDELENIRLAWRILVDTKSIDELHRAVESIYTFYDTRSWYREGAALFQYAVDQLQEEFAILPKAPSNLCRFQSKLLSRLGRFYFYMGNHDYSIALVERALAIAQKCGEKYEIAYCHARLGYVASATGHYVQANNLFQQSRQLYQELNDAPGMAYTFNYLGVVAHETGKLIEASRLYHESYQRAKQLNNAILLSITLHNLGKIHQELGDYTKGLKYLKESLDYQYMLNDKEGIGYVFSNMAQILSDLGEYEQSKRDGTDALALFQEINYPRGTAFALRQLALNAYRTGAYSEARIRLSECLEVAISSGFQLEAAVGKYLLGYVELAENNLREAERFGADALEMCQELGLRSEEGHTYNLLGQIASANQAYEQAESYFLKSIVIGQEIHVVPVLLEALFGIASLWMARGAEGAALSFMVFVHNHEASTHAMKRQVTTFLSQLDSQCTIDIKKEPRVDIEQWNLEAAVEQATYLLSASHSSPASSNSP